MAFYYDSSIILSSILEESRAFDPAEAWDSVALRVSSNLMKVECIVGVRRAGLAQKLPLEDEWVTHRMDILEPYFSGIHFKLMDQAVEDVVRGKPDLARCRSLDAVHLATALYLKAQMDEDLVICSLDKRLREIRTIVVVISRCPVVCTFCRGSSSECIATTTRTLVTNRSNIGVTIYVTPIEC